MKCRIEKITTETARKTGTIIKSRLTSQDNMPVFPLSAHHSLTSRSRKAAAPKEGASIFSGSAIRSAL